MKRGIPVLWLITSIATFSILFFTLGEGSEDRLIVYLAMGSSAIFAGCIYKFFIADLADEVIDHGDHLIFRKGQLKQTVELRDIINIRRAYSSKNDKVILTVQSNGPIGNKLTFLAEYRVVRFTEHPIVIELRQRVEAAQR